MYARCPISFRLTYFIEQLRLQDGINNLEDRSWPNTSKPVNHLLTGVVPIISRQHRQNPCGISMRPRVVALTKPESYLLVAHQFLSLCLRREGPFAPAGITTYHNADKLQYPPGLPTYSTSLRRSRSTIRLNVTPRPLSVTLWPTQ